MAVGASMAIPGLAPPVARQRGLLVDGGVLNNLPIDVMADDEPGPIVAVDVMRRLHEAVDAGRRAAEEALAAGAKERLESALPVPGAGSTRTAAVAR